MTLGASPSPADVVAELGESFPYTFPDARTRWLADVGTSDPITFPTSFANKTSIKHVDTTSVSSLGTSHSFSNVSFGASFTGRRIHVLIFAMSKNQLDTGSWTIGAVTIGNDSDADGTLVWFQDGNDSTVLAGAGDATASPTGTSGTISFSTASATRCLCVVLSIANTPYAFTDELNAFDENTTGASGTLDIPSNGVILAAATKANGNSISFSGVTLQGQSSPLAGYRIAWGWTNRASSQTGRSVGFSSTGNASCALRATSRAQG